MNAASTPRTLGSGRPAPGPRGPPVVGFLREIRGDRLGFMGSLAREYPDICRFRVGPRVVHLIIAPELVKYVLQDNSKNFGKQSRAFQTLKPLLGQGLVTSEGAFWLRQRRIAQPAFHKDRIAAFAQLMVESTQQMLTRWDGLAAAGQPVDMHVEMMRLTLRIVGLSLMSTDVSAQSDKVGSALAVALEFALDRITRVLALPRFVPTRENRRLNTAIRDLDEVVMGMIEGRRRSGARLNDLLDMLMYAKDEETGESMSDRQLRDEVMTLFLAGHETTANALTWALMLLSQHPDIARRLHREVVEALGDRTPVLADLGKMPYARQVVAESMRLYPPVWTISRSVTADDQIGGYDIPRGSVALVSPYLTHRSPSVWKNPEGFDPDRFAPEEEAKIPRFAYFPFGGGPRLCIGNNFALMEAQLLLAMIARAYQPELVPFANLEPEPLITLRPKHGMPMILRPARG